MRVKFLLCIILILFGALSILAQDKVGETTTSEPLINAYDVSFSLSERGGQRLTFLVFADGRGTFRLVGKRLPPSVATPAVWDRITPTLISFSGEVQFPIGNCCRETGTLSFKGEIGSNGVITGRSVFVTNTPDPTNPTGFVTRAGEFIATPLPIVTID